jgi:methylenetetrahydrofolate reductase (NADPH)
MVKSTDSLSSNEDSANNTAISNGVHNDSKNSHQSYVPLVKRIYQRIESGDVPFFSFEFFPPKTKEAAINLISRFDCFRQSGPLFCDITWHAAGNPAGDSETSSITIAGVALNYCGLETMLHITCVGLTETDLRNHLDRAKSLGIRNILALRGDKDANAAESEFHYAIDLVRYIRKEYGDYFTIAVAGYPTKHPEAISFEMDLQNLKEKVDAGADFIITQLFFESKVFIDFVNKCRDKGIKVPILPGIMPIQSYDSLDKIVRLSKLDIPEKLLNELKPIKSNDEAVRKYGIEWAVNLCRELIESKMTPGLHFYTLNREHATIKILKALQLWNTCIKKPLPWTPPANHRRCSEDVRPIFWSTRPKSYVCRTQDWDEFPNGRWGRGDSPAFRDLKDYYLFLEPTKSKEVLLNMWGKELKCEEDVWHVFYCYVSGNKNKYNNSVTSIPWNDEELSPETGLIADKLALYNKRGVLTINSQPNVNGVDSSHPVHGWGIQNGYVYQKVSSIIVIKQSLIYFLAVVLFFLYISGIS